jgi:hypothetical protein
MNKIPADVKKELFRIVSERADKHDYCNRPRPENHRFMLDLTNDPLIGGRIAEFLGQEKVKTYLKDTLLHDYAALHRHPVKAADSYIKSLGWGELFRIDTPKGKPSLFRLQNGQIVAAEFTSYLKWETGMRKLLLYLAGKSELRKKNLRLVLIICDQKRVICESEKKLVMDALALIKIQPVWDVKC